MLAPNCLSCPIYPQGDHFSAFLSLSPLFSPSCLFLKPITVGTIHSIATLLREFHFINSRVVEVESPGISLTKEQNREKQINTS
jgi:hypothetical protein